MSSHVNADLLPSFDLPEKPLLEFLENGPSWMPKPYKIPFDHLYSRMVLMKAISDLGIEVQTLCEFSGH